MWVFTLLYGYSGTYSSAGAARHVCLCRCSITWHQGISRGYCCRPCATRWFPSSSLHPHCLQVPTPVVSSRRGVDNQRGGRGFLCVVVVSVVVFSVVLRGMVSGYQTRRNFNSVWENPKPLSLRGHWRGEKGGYWICLENYYEINFRGELCPRIIREMTGFLHLSKPVRTGSFQDWPQEYFCLNRQLSKSKRDNLKLLHAETSFGTYGRYLLMIVTLARTYELLWTDER